MINFIKRTNLFLIISSVTIVVSLLLVLVFGLKPGIDFTGGTVVQISGVTTQDGSEVSKDEVSHILSDQGVDVVSVSTIERCSDDWYYYLSSLFVQCSIVVMSTHHIDLRCQN